MVTGSTKLAPTNQSRKIRIHVTGQLHGQLHCQNHRSKSPVHRNRLAALTCCQHRSQMLIRTRITKSSGQSLGPQRFSPALGFFPTTSVPRKAGESKIRFQKNLNSKKVRIFPTFMQKLTTIRFVALPKTGSNPPIDGETSLSALSDPAGCGPPAESPDTHAPIPEIIPPETACPPSAEPTD